MKEQHKASNHCYKCGRKSSEALLMSKQPYLTNENGEVMYWCANDKECLQAQAKRNE